MKNILIYTDKSESHEFRSLLKNNPEDFFTIVFVKDTEAESFTEINKFLMNYDLNNKINITSIQHYQDQQKFNNLTYERIINYYLDKKINIKK